MTKRTSAKSAPSDRSSTSAVQAERLAIEADHARRVAEAERRSLAAEREAQQRALAAERAASEAEMRAQIAALNSRSSRRSSRNSIENWLDANFATTSKNCASAPREDIATNCAPETQNPSSPPAIPAACDAVPAGPAVPMPMEGPHGAAFKAVPQEQAAHSGHFSAHPIVTDPYIPQNNTIGTHTHNCITNKSIENHHTLHLARAVADVAIKAAQSSKVSAPLPLFDGRATDWLIFKKSYDKSSPALTPTENLARLNASLRGAARDHVAILLAATRDPREVIHALEVFFARPEFIILSEISAMRALPKISNNESMKELNLFACKVRRCTEVVRLLNRPEYLASPDLANEILTKFTPLLRIRWADYAASKETLDKFRLELLSEFLMLEAELRVRYGTYSEQVKPEPPKRQCHPLTSCHSTIDKVAICPYCSKSHNIETCKEFSLATVEDRWKWVIANKVCYKCLQKPPHQQRLKTTSPSSDDTAPSSSATVTHSRSLPTSQRPLLKVVPVTVAGPKGTFDTFALLDDGSTATLLDSSVASAIGAKGRRSHIKIDGIGGMSTESDISLVDITIKGRYSTEWHSLENVRSIPNLNLGPQHIDREFVKGLHYLSDLVDFICYEHAKPMLLIGIDNWNLTLPTEIRQSSKSQPVAGLTPLGWVLFGFSSSKTKPIEFVNHTISTTVNPSNSYESLENLIKEDYKLDSIGIVAKDYRTPTEQRALDLLESTTTRLPSGRFETGLLWRDNLKDVPNNYKLALSRFKSLERKLIGDKSLAESYRQQINANIVKGYAEICTEPADPSKVTWYLPHFGVVHPQKKKLRVVHDAAATFEGVSLNSMLLAGPDLLQPLLAILMRFREGRIALNGDIREMFPQIKIRKEDRDAQRFLWRNEPSQPILEYRMSSMIFGAVSSPCTALYLKNKNALDHKKEFPMVVDAVVNNHYMDDYLGSVDSADEAARLVADIVEVHSRAGFEMRNWVSNSKEALTLIPRDLCAANILEVNLANNAPNHKILGVSWNIVDDSLGLLRSLPPIHESSKWTKRHVLSLLMQVYDPLGFLAPIVIRGRILFQQTWRLGINWDDHLPSEILLKWKHWFEHLSNLRQTSIPRCYTTCEWTEKQLHVFADASEYAYSCVAYWRFITPNDCKISLIGGKARLAPLKPASIPKLELQAALIAARFCKYLIEAHKHKPVKIFLWSDSLTVLKWLRSDARNFKVFVSHRVGEILELTDISCWKYVPTHLNVADDATRPQSKFEISRWFSGPPFLLLGQNEWPEEPSTNVRLGPEEMKCDRELVALTTDNSPELSPVVANHCRFSNWLRLVHATATVALAAKFFIHLLFRKIGNRVDEAPSRRLQASDLVASELRLLLRSQLDSFGEERRLIKAEKPLPSRSRLRRLAVTLDDSQILKLAGRTRACAGSITTSNPIVLDGKHPIVKLLIKYHHNRAAHANTELIVNELRQNSSPQLIFGIRPAVKKVANECMMCHLRKRTHRPHLSVIYLQNGWLIAYAHSPLLG
ncbi:uncharacterized protein LOC131854763 [Achroia grisella]|uniref:uncharacterized protein LOC131854763 n=1 Tax=Achroia grisella TaxID=688607 RepID=UPI0027D23D2C|nr:uncharacterized protein LOC131854763 [Achroia grisella]